MRFRQILNMNIVPDAGAILSIIIISKYSNAFALAKGYLQYKRNQMSLRIVIFTYHSVFMGSGHIKIPEGYKFNAMSILCPLHHFFHCKLGFSIRVSRQRPVGLKYRNTLRLSVCSRSGRKDNPSDPVPVHCLQQHLGTMYIIVIIRQRLLHTHSYQ